MSTAQLIILAIGGRQLYFHPIWQTFEAIVYNISYGWALYCLYVFYLAIKKLVSPFRPIAKFASVKSIIFATYYQSIVLRLLLSRPETAMAWNDFLLSLEMILFTLAFMSAFPVREFLGGMPQRQVLQNIKDAFSIKDVLQNIYHNFRPEYEDYALQKCETEIPATIGAGAEEASVYKITGNINKVAQEMTRR